MYGFTKYEVYHLYILKSKKDNLKKNAKTIKNKINIF